MRADGFVGSVVDVPEHERSVIHDASVEASGDGRALTMSFTATIHAGRNESDMSWWLPGTMGAQRVMWATGLVGGHGASCTAPLHYHGGERTIASLAFPGYGTPCTD